jgi:AmmeMemoRadiSam system protein A
VSLAAGERPAGGGAGVTATLAPEDRAVLRALARAAVAHALGAGPAPGLPAAGPLAAPAGAFVALDLGGAPRGAVGSLAPRGSLAATVAAAARAAALDDPRFPPLGPADLAALEIRVTAAGPAAPLAGPAALDPARHGLLVRRGLHRGVLLPAEAARGGWDAGAFLKHACLRAGLHARAWQEPGTDVLAFEAEEL